MLKDFYEKMYPDERIFEALDELHLKILANSTDYKLYKYHFEAKESVAKLTAELKQGDTRTTSEKLQAVKWGIIRVEPLSIYFESCFGVGDEEALALEAVFTKGGLNPIFECQSFLHFNGVFSATVVHRLEHPYWVDDTIPNEQKKLAYFEANIDKVFQSKIQWRN